MKVPDKTGGKKGKGGAPGPRFLRMMDAVIRAFHPPEGMRGGSRRGYMYDDVVILDEFAVAHGLDAGELRRAVPLSGFFALEDIRVKHGSVFTKEVIHKAIVEGTAKDLARAVRTSPGHVSITASREDSLFRRYRRAIDEELTEALKGQVSFTSPLQYQREPVGRGSIEASAGIYESPSEDSGGGAADLRRGDGPDGGAGAAETPGTVAPGAGQIAGQLRRKLPRDLAFTFRDGTVAGSMETWVRALAGAPEDEVRELLMSGHAGEWLRSAGQADLADAARSVRERLEAAGASGTGPVKPRLFRRFRETDAGEALFMVGADPFLDRIASGGGDDPEGDVDAVAALGGRLAVEPLLEGLFTSPPDTRRAIIRGLGELGDRRATPKLVKMLEFSQEKDDRLAALEALGKLADPRAVEALGRAAEGGGDVGKRAREILDGLDV